MATFILYVFVKPDTPSPEGTASLVKTTPAAVRVNR